LNSSSSSLNSLLCNSKDPTKTAEDLEALTRLAHNPDLQAFLRWLEWQNSTALQPVDLSQNNLLALVGEKKGIREMIFRIAKLFENL